MRSRNVELRTHAHWRARNTARQALIVYPKQPDSFVRGNAPGRAENLCRGHALRSHASTRTVGSHDASMLARTGAKRVSNARLGLRRAPGCAWAMPPRHRGTCGATGMVQCKHVGFGLQASVIRGRLVRVGAALNGVAAARPPMQATVPTPAKVYRRVRVCTDRPGRPVLRTSCGMRAVRPPARRKAQGSGLQRDAAGAGHGAAGCPLLFAAHGPEVADARPSVLHGPARVCVTSRAAACEGSP